MTKFELALKRARKKAKQEDGGGTLGITVAPFIAELRELLNDEQRRGRIDGFSEAAMAGFGNALDVIQGKKSDPLLEAAYREVTRLVASEPDTREQYDAKGLARRVYNTGPASKIIKEVKESDKPAELDIFTSPEGIRWINRSSMNKALVRDLSQIDTDDYDRMLLYNALSPMNNTYPAYFRDTVLCIAWEVHAKRVEKGKTDKNIFRVLNGILWLLHHLERFGYSKAFTIARLRNDLKTNRHISDFYSESVEVMERNYDVIADNDYSVIESDYYQYYGETALAPDARQSERIQGALTVSLDADVANAIYNYITGLKALIKARVERYVDLGYPAFVRPKGGLNVFLCRLFKGYGRYKGANNIAVKTVSRAVFPPTCTVFLSLSRIVKYSTA